MSSVNKDLLMVLTVKDKDGHTLDGVESLNFDVKVSQKEIPFSETIFDYHFGSCRFLIHPS